ncbi:hypothetical protein HW115_18900 [Verrucomicrobiaceae bacterium N1E253]|uniref:Uncharacterized protein n=1 Tax=Oceaniferula marina TaxID=2748318 RepID=A0A851GTR0_9BACT|nr:hypothetical protein [Oceaniferula marina]NWK57694.1 hypothetical protein [Oceaniferula marina]
MKHTLIVYIALFGLLVTPSNSQESKITGNVKKVLTKVELEGRWQTVQMGGEDIGDHIDQIEFIFKRDGSFKASATIKGEGVVSYEGSYKIKKSQLILKIAGEDAQNSSYSFRNGNLVLHDDKIDSWIELKKQVKPEIKRQNKSQHPTASS